MSLDSENDNVPTPSNNNNRNQTITYNPNDFKEIVKSLKNNPLVVTEDDIIKEEEFIKSFAAGQTKTKLQTRGTKLKKIDDEDFIEKLKQHFKENYIHVNVDKLSDEFVPQYDINELLLFLEMEKTDGYFADCIETLSSFVFADVEKIRFVLDTNWSYKTPEEEKEALNLIAADNELIFYLTRLALQSQKVKFFENFTDTYEQSKIYARAALNVEYNKETIVDEEENTVDVILTTPRALKKVSPLSLGQVYVNQDDWTAQVIENKDYEFPYSMIPADRMVYVTNDDRNSAIGSLHYGQALSEKVKTISILNKMINERSLYELNYRSFSPRHILQILGAPSEAYVNKITALLEEASNHSFAIQQPLEIKTIEAAKTDDLVAQRESNITHLIRMCRIPEMVFNPNVMNRATAQEIMQVYYVTFIRAERARVSGIIRDQWINPFLRRMIYKFHKKEIDEKRARLIAGEDLESINFPEFNDIPTGEDGSFQFPNLQMNTLQTIKRIMLDEKGEIDLNMMGWKIKIAFPELDFDTQKEKILSLSVAKEKGFISTEGAQKRLGYDDEIEKTKLMQEQQQKADELLFSDNQGFMEIEAETMDNSQSTSTGADSIAEQQFKQSIRQ